MASPAGAAAWHAANAHSIHKAANRKFLIDGHLRDEALSDRPAGKFAYGAEPQGDISIVNRRYTVFHASIFFIRCPMGHIKEDVLKKFILGS